MIVTFALLTLAVLALWIAGDDRAPAGRRFAWLILFAGSLAAALAAGIVRPIGLIWVILFALAAWAFGLQRAGQWVRMVATVILLGLAVGLMTHQLPGFNNPRVISSAHFSSDAAPYSLHLNFDKTVAGIFIFAFCVPRPVRADGRQVTLIGAALSVAGLILVIMASSLAIGYVRFAPKFPAEAPLWLWANLCLTCFSEEALFRGFIQNQLHRAWKNAPHGEWLALLVAALLFGVAHVAGGAVYVALATVAGVGYGWVYLRTGQLEASILTHFALNTVHFFLFTYPALKAT